MGSRTPDGDGLGRLVTDLADIRRRLQNLEAPSGTSVRSLVDQVKAKLAELDATVTTLVNAAIATNSYTKAQIDNRVANPPTGSNVTGNITATGDVSGSTGIFPTGVRSTGAYSYVAGANRFTMWIDPSGQMGIAPSSARFKTDIETWDFDVSQLLQLRGVLFRYDPEMFPDQWMDPNVPKEFGFIAEELLDLGFPMLVIFDADGLPSGIAYERMVVVLLMLAQWEHDRIESRFAGIEARLAAL